MINELSEELNHVIDALAEDFYHPLGPIPLEGFTADRDMTLSEAESASRVSWPEGTVWGGPWDYAWMFGSFTVPPEAAGERSVMDLSRKGARNDLQPTAPAPGPPPP